MAIMLDVRSPSAGLSERDNAAITAGRYGMAFAVMREMGWSWRDLCDAPFDLVQEILVRLSAEREWTGKKADMSESKTRSKRGG